jgi:hypothetical protein
MVNNAFDLPMWGPGHFYVTGKSYVDFDVCMPLARRPAGLDTALALEQADQLLANEKWKEALDILAPFKEAPLARPLIMDALTKLGDDSRIVKMLWPPVTNAEMVLVGGAILNLADRAAASEFLKFESVSASKDASVREITQRLKRRWSK